MPKNNDIILFTGFQKNELLRKLQSVATTVLFKTKKWTNV